MISAVTKLRSLCLVVPIITLFTACNKAADGPNTGPASAASGAPSAMDQRKLDSLTANQKQALAYAAKAARYTLTDLEAAIEQWRLAIKTEPDSREWQEGLAFELWRAKRTSEAIPIWKKLATGNDDIAARSAKMLKKTAGGVDAKK